MLQPRNSWYYRPDQSAAAEPVEIVVTGHLWANDSETLRDTATARLGIALLPTWLIADDLRAGRLTAVTPELEWLIAPGPERAIWAIYPPKKIMLPMRSGLSR